MMNFYKTQEKIKRNNRFYQIDYVPFGIANRFPNYRIELHKDLQREEYKPLLKELICHEILHSDVGCDMSDIALDLSGIENKKLYYKFILTHPTSLMQFSPLYFSKNKLYFDVSVFLLWMLLFGMIGLLIYTTG